MRKLNKKAKLMSSPSLWPSGSWDIGPHGSGDLPGHGASRPRLISSPAGSVAYDSSSSSIEVGAESIIRRGWDWKLPADPGEG